MKLKTVELTLTQLDYAVAKMMDVPVNIASMGNTYPNLIRFKEKPLNLNRSSPNFSPTSDWLVGGAVLDWCDMEFKAVSDGMMANVKNGISVFGENHLISGMRAAVIDCFGTEVEIPDELIGV